MATQDGFHYVKGPCVNVLSKILSTATFKARVPVTLTTAGLVCEATGGSDVTAIYGISMHDAADSIYPQFCMVEVPTPDTVYVAKCATDASSSELSVGRGVDIEKSGNYFIIDEDSQATPMVTLVPRDGFDTLDSADSSVHFSWLGDKLGVFHSNASVNIFT